MKYFSLLISSILLTLSCSIIQKPITVTITNPHGFNISGQEITIKYGSYSGDIQGRVYTTASASGATYSLTDYTAADDFAVFVTLDSATTGSSIAGEVILNAITTQDANVILYYNEWLGNAVSGWGAAGLAGGASRVAAAVMPSTEVWYSDTLTVGNERWYKLPTTADSQYAISWDDAGDGTSTTADLKVTVYDSSLNVRLRPTDAGYTNSNNFVSVGTYALVKVEGYYGTESGTFRIGYAPIESVVVTRLSNNPKSTKPHFTGKNPKWPQK